MSDEILYLIIFISVIGFIASIIMGLYEFFTKRPCPYCKKKVMRTATKCPYCHSDIKIQPLL